MALGLIWVAVAAADAPDPVDNSNKTFPAIDSATATVQLLPGGKVQVTIKGGWTWTTHGSSCTDDRAGVGYAVDWNDPTQVGNPVKVITFTENGQTITEDVRVGALAANALNPIDNVVHPTRNSKTGDFTGVVDPATPSASWRGGCGEGRDANGTLINTRGVGAGTANGFDQSKIPRGRWGPISHIFAKASDITRICAITYDVHKGTAPDNNNGVGIPSGLGEVTAGGSSRNQDNGAEKNSGTPLGNACPTIPVPQPNIHIVKLPKNQTVPALGTALFKIQISNNGNVDLTNVQITDAQALGCGGPLATLVPGSLGNLAKGTTVSYDCFQNNVGSAFTNIATACGDGGGTTVCDDDQAAVDHRADVGIEDLTSNQDLVPNDTAALTGAINPQGTITFKLYKGDCATGTLLFTSSALSLASAGSPGSGNTLLLSALLAAQGLGPNTAGTYYWGISYSGDINTDLTQRNAAFSECAENFTVVN